MINPCVRSPCPFLPAADSQDLFPSPRGASLAIEWSCSFGQAVVWLDTDTGEFKQAVTDSDSHFLAWAPDGESLYLKVNTINHPQIVRLHVDGSRETSADHRIDIRPRAGSGRTRLYLFLLTRDGLRQRNGHWPGPMAVTSNSLRPTRSFICLWHAGLPTESRSPI